MVTTPVIHTSLMITTNCINKVKNVVTFMIHEDDIGNPNGSHDNKLIASKKVNMIHEADTGNPNESHDNKLIASTK